MKTMTFRPRLIPALIGLLFASTVAAETMRPSSAKSPVAPVQGDVLQPLSQRFANDDVKEVPDFQRHVVPLLGRLGCNGRACHGSFQGRGGFQLSLFGYDFKADHTALLDEATGRVDVEDVRESLILAKPTDADMHEGGKRFDLDSWQDHVLSRWIEAGAAYADKQPQVLSRLEIVPSEVRFDDEGQTTSIRAIAHWKDGTREDVTELCRFSSNDDSIAAIDEDGSLVSGQTGDTHVVVYYDNAVVPVPVLRPVGPIGEPTGGESPTGEIKSAGKVTKTGPQTDHVVDRWVDVKLQKLGIIPAENCTDAEFLRRASLDITGILPSADAVREFLADPAPDKRESLIDELLDSPGYAAWWATRLSDWTGNSEEQLNNVLPVRDVAGKMWYQWLRTRLEENVPYDQIVEGIVTAESRQPGESYREYCESMTRACMPDGEDEFAQRDGLPMYWARRNFQKPEERAIGFAYSFLGVRIECAQCHKHPFDQWSKDDFEQFAKLFSPIRANQNLVAKDAEDVRDELLASINDGKTKLKGGDLRRAVYKAAQQGQVVPFGELVVNVRKTPAKGSKARMKAKQNGKNAAMSGPSGRILGQEDELFLDKDPRGELMAWLRSPDNPYFAKAIVNRVWSNYFGIGIVDPSDDMNLANPPSNAPLLDDLAEQFVANGFDLRWLHRTIATSRTYARSAQTNPTNVHDQKNFSRHVPHRLPAEVVYDAVVLATGSDEHAERMRTKLDDLAIADGKPRLRNRQDFAMEVFGQSIRESNCDCDRSNAPSLLQSIYLRNDSDMYKRLSGNESWVSESCNRLGVAGPDSRVDPKAMAIQRRAVELQTQFKRRVQMFADLGDARQSKMREQLEREYERAQRRFKQFGFSVPTLQSLINDVDSWTSIDSDDASSSEGGSTITLEQLVEEAYLRTLSRFPETDEAEISIAFIKESENPADGLQSLLWALVNTKEFIISHCSVYHPSCRDNYYEIESNLRWSLSSRHAACRNAFDRRFIAKRLHETGRCRASHARTCHPRDLYRAAGRPLTPGYVRYETERPQRDPRFFQADQNQCPRHRDFRASSEAGQVC